MSGINITKKTRPARVPRKYLVSPSSAARYAVEFLALILLASVDRYGSAFALGLFTGLVYARRNLAVLAPMYVVAAIIFSPSWWTLLYVIVPALLLALLYFIYFRLKKNVPLAFATLTALISFVPYAVCTVLFGGDLSGVLISMVIVAVFSFCAEVVCYALLLRGFGSKFTLDELICGGISIAVFSFALASVGLYGFNLFFLIAPFAVILCASCFTPAVALVTSTLMGIGAALQFGALEICAVTVIWSAAALALSSFTKYASAAGIVAADALIWFASGYAGSGWKSLALVAVGVLVFLFIPKNFTSKLSRRGKRSGTAALNGIVNRNRAEVSAKLFSASEVFYDMSISLAGSESSESYYTAKRLASEVAKNYCGRCQDREGCFSSLGGDTAPVLEPMADAVLARGKVTILDMPPFITSRCKKMNNLASVINNAGEAYRERRKAAGGILETKRAMSEQFAGMSLALDSLARECGEHVSFGEETQDGIGAELLRHNIVANEIVVSGKKDGVSVTLAVRECDADKAVLPRIVSNALKTRLEVAQITPRGEEKIVHLAAAPVFEIGYGIAEKKRGGEEVSGDSKSILCPSRRRRLFALSDGMGSGENAAFASKNAIGMVENFYRAGFDNAIILSLVNKLLGYCDGEGFSSLDIAVIDTFSGGMDIVKLGSAPSFVVHRETVEVISSAAPPAGILEKVEPVTSRRQLYDGDMVIMMSDGVFDALDERGVTAATDELATANPQTLAEELLSRAVAAGAEDDCTVMVLRLIAV